jgi:hypothetical protein
MSNEEKQQDLQAPVTPWNLAIYYRRIFPSHIYCKWLAYGERESTVSKAMIFVSRDNKTQIICNWVQSFKIRYYRLIISYIFARFCRVVLVVTAQLQCNIQEK